MWLNINLSNLTFFDIGCCLSVTDVGLSAIARNCPLLTSLSLLVCSAVSDIGVLAITQGCPHLVSINLENTAISDACLVAIADGCPQLMFINISGCYNATDIGISAIRLKCVYLQVMYD